MKKLFCKIIGLAVPLAMMGIMAATPTSASRVRARLGQRRTVISPRRYHRSRPVRLFRRSHRSRREGISRRSKLFRKRATGRTNRRSHLMTHGKLNYQMRVDHDANLYNLPRGLKGSRKIDSVANLNLLHHWVHVNAVANTNPFTGYYRFGHNNQNYWILGRDLSFNLRALRGRNRRIERVISTGERMINKSRYHERSRRYDCSSFVAHIFAKSGIHLASTTYGQVSNGRRDHHLRRGDLIFFNDHEGRDHDGDVGGKDCHEGVYLGHGLFLDDSPYSDNHGVDVASLHDPMWNSNSRRYKSVHKFNHNIRRVI